MQRVGDECREADLTFFLEPVTFAAKDADPAAKPERVERSVMEWTRPRYGVDVLKVEVPVDPTWLEPRALAAGGGRTRVLDAFRPVSEAATRPLVFLSAGVDMVVFVRALEFAGEAGADFAGVLCGRATWQGGVAAYAAGGASALEAWLADEGTANGQRLNAVLEQVATPL